MSDLNPEVSVAAAAPLEPPTCDDKPIWDLWLSQWQLPTVLVADELGLFELLERRPSDLRDICGALNLRARPMEAVLAVLCAMGYTVKRQSQFHLTDLTRNFLLRQGSFYWGGMLRGVGDGQRAMETLKEALHRDNRGPEARVTRVWEAGQMTPEDARRGNRSMHSHSFPAAVGMAKHGAFAGVRRLLDVAGGSGCFSIALARQYPDIRCTVAELPVVAADTRQYLARYGVEDRVDTHEFNMFRDAWPQGYDAIFFSNVFHDWDPERRDELARRCFDSLPAGGRVYLHEMLLNDAQDGPLTAALFSLLMLIGTRGKQFSAAELEEMLGGAGFIDMTVTHSYAHYSLVVATKPE